MFSATKPEDCLRSEHHSATAFLGDKSPHILGYPGELDAESSASWMICGVGSIGFPTERSIAP